MNNENNNGLNNQPGVPPQNGPAGLNDIINNNAGVTSPVAETPVAPVAPVSPVGPMGPDPVVNPMDEVVAPASNVVDNQAGQMSVDNQVVMPSQEPVAPVAPEPIAPAAPVQSENVYTSVPGQQATPEVTPTPAGPTPVMPSGQPMPSFTPGTIGTNPPINNEENTGKKAKKEGKKGMNKVLFVILLIVIMAAIGGGIYWYLNLSKDSGINVVLKDVVYDLNEEPSTDIADYATITGANSSSCVLDTSKIDSTKVGAYDYTITCNSEVFTGKATVADASAPVVSTISVYKTVNSDIEASEFIATCYDSTECSYSFEDEEAVKALMTTAGGPTKVNIIVQDESDNSVTVEGNLNVIPSQIRAYYDCSSAGQNVDGFNATMVLTHSLGILTDTATDGSLQFGNFGTQTYVYTFTDQEQYDELLASFKNDGRIVINDITGVPDFDEENMTITLVSDLNTTGLKTQYGEDKFISFKTISELYRNTLGYTCAQKTS